MRTSLSLSLFAPLRTIAAVVLAGFLVPAIGPGAHAQQAELVDRIAAVVGEDIILKSEVDQMVRRRAQQQNASYSDDLWMESLQSLVDQKILAEKARRDTTLEISDQQVSNQLDRQVERLQQRAGGRQQLEQIYGQSILEIKETFRPELRDQLLAQRLRQRRMQDIDVTPSEVRQWFERIPTDSLPDIPPTVRLSHIVRFPKPTDEARQEARETITSIRDSIVNDGASFEQMAREFSDHATASSGGRLSGVVLEDLVPEFAAVASRTPIGSVSQVFYNESQNGFHILRVNSKSGDTIDLNHILITVDGTNAEEARARLRAVRDTLLNDEEVPFERLARRHSEEDRSAQNGGRVTDPQSGTRDLVLERLNPSWRQTIENLEVGEISKPTKVQLLNGEEAFHIVRLDRRTPAHRANLEMDYERIRQLALQDKRSRKMQEWIDDLRDEVYVDIRITERDLTAMRGFR